MGGLAHVHVPAMVHPLCAVLAAGPVGPDRLSVRVAAAAPIPHSRSRRSRHPRNHLSGHHTSVPAPDRAIPNLMLCQPHRPMPVILSAARDEVTAESKDP